MLPAAIAVVSAGVLAYEVLLMRLFAIVQWHHFAYMVISIALLGFGASGTLLALLQDRLRQRFVPVFAAGAALFGVAAVASFALAVHLPFNALAVIWDPRQLVYLLVLYALFTVPFLLGASCIGLAFVCLPASIGRIYAFNLVGSGLGALGVVMALFVLSPPDTLRLVGALGFAAGALACLEGGRGRRRWAAAGLLAGAVLVPVEVPQSWTELRLSEFKGLSQALAVPGAAVVAEHSSPLGLLSVVESPRIPLRHVPGLSLNATAEPPRQLGVFTDGDSLSAITAFDGRLEALKYLDFTTAALPYHLAERPAVLILGAGGGADVLQALYHEAARIDAVELNPGMVHLVSTVHGDFAGHLYARPDVRVHVAEARGFIAGSEAKWDVIQIPLLDSLAASAAGVHALSESYVYTIEAFRLYLGHLAQGGLVAVTRWLKLPPRDSLKLFATAREALELEGVAEPARHLVMVRSWNTTTLLVKNEPFAAAEIAAVRAFAKHRSFDLAYYPGIGREETNRWNVLDAPYFFEGISALVGAQSADLVGRYKFDIAPATDDRPYFFDFFKWRTLPEFVRLRQQGAAALIEWGYPILFATLVQAAVLSIVLIVLPLLWRGRESLQHPDRWRIGAYFFGLGLAFLFVEIAFIQRFILFLSHPLYAVAVVIAGFLVFAGMGSGAASVLARRLEGAPPQAPGFAGGLSAIELAVFGIALVAILYLALLPPVFHWLGASPDGVRIAVSFTLIAPLAFCMGMPFPLGLRRVVAAAPEFVPWAWGVNGCASVLSAVLATILAIHFGFTVVVALAVLLYLAAAAAFRAPLSQQSGRTTGSPGA